VKQKYVLYYFLYKYLNVFCVMHCIVQCVYVKCQFLLVSHLHLARDMDSFIDL